ncbi:hypothetical protein [Occultella kanbiaonis]|uniref:hypothetical protein n=1 Tax=Occultella kanbiaonis TaxID=2675754 RepID=UPI0013D32CCA|nr:hypothetical protein [Occultella kanbiaonis]
MGSVEPDGTFVAHAPGVEGWQGRVLDAANLVRRPFEVRVGATGIEVRGRSSFAATWDELETVHLLGNARRRYLVLRRTDHPRPERPTIRERTRDALLWTITMGPGLTPPVIPMDMLDADLLDILEAIKDRSGGRFPDPERTPRRPNGDRRDDPRF